MGITPGLQAKMHQIQLLWAQDVMVWGPEGRPPPQIPCQQIHPWQTGPGKCPGATPVQEVRGKVAHVIRKIEKPSLDECKAEKLSDEVLGFGSKRPEDRRAE